MRTGGCCIGYRLDSRSRMSGDAHVRICESLGVQFPRATRLFVTIHGRRQYLWRAVDQDGDLLDILVQSRRDRRAAVRFFRKVLKGQGRSPRRLVTDKLRSYSAAHQYRHADRGAQHSAVREQPSGGLASTDAATRATDAEVHLRRTRTTFPIGAWRRIESVPDTLSSAPSLPLACCGHVRSGGGVRSRVSQSEV